MTERPARRTTAVLLAAVLLALAGCSNGSADTVADQGFISGDGTVTQLAATERMDPVAFGGTTLDGTPFDLRSLRGHVVVVNVWASWCAPCIAEAPGLQQVHEETQAEGVRFIGINTEADQAAARAHERRFGVTYPSLADDGGRVLLRLRGSLPPTATPSTLVLDRHGRVAARVIGRVDASTLRSLVADARTEPRA
jgi:thiol-disulfide isomerase/thioredoxin